MWQERSATHGKGTDSGEPRKRTAAAVGRPPEIGKRLTMKEIEIQAMTNRDLAMSLQFAVFVPTDADAIKIIKEAIRRLETLPDEDK